MRGIGRCPILSIDIVDFVPFDGDLSDDFEFGFGYVLWRKAPRRNL
jgi:hypothetical protein